MARLTRRREQVRDELRTGFWFVPTLALVLAVIGGLGLPRLEAVYPIQIPLIPPGDQVETARDITSTVAQITASVGGLTFSVTLVTVTIAAQLYSPRVLRVFRGNRLYQTTLAGFLGTFVFSLLVLVAMRSAPPFVPELSLALSLAATVVTFGLFIAFITDLIRSTEAETVVRRLAEEGQMAIGKAWPKGVGENPQDAEVAWRRAQERMRGEPHLLRAERAGFLVSIDGEVVLDAAAEADGLVRQRVPIGDFVVSGQTVAEAWCAEEECERLAERVLDGFSFGQQRTIVQDVAFPIRQLVDLALRGFSPSLNDFTSAETAIGSVTDTLVRLVDEDEIPRLRVDTQGEPRLVACAHDLDDLVRLGFEQFRIQAASDTTVCLRLLTLLACVRDAALHRGRELSEPQHQARLIHDYAQRASPAADREAVERTYRRLFVDDADRRASAVSPAGVMGSEG